MKKMKVGVAVLMMASLFIVGCGTIMSGTKNKVAVQSNPTNADVTVQTIGGLQVATGRTPMTFHLQVKNDYYVVVSMKGYETKKVMVSRDFNTWVIGNLICGGIPGLIVDALSGAIYKLEPNEFMVTLQPQTGDAGSDMILSIYARTEEGKVYRYETTMVASLPPMTVE